MSIRIWEISSDDLSNLNCLSGLKRHKSSIVSLSWSPTAQQFVSTAHDGSIQFWEPNADSYETATPRGERQQVCRGFLQPHRKPTDNHTAYAAWSPISENLVVVFSYNDNMLYLIHADTQTLTRTVSLGFQHSAQLETIPTFVTWDPTGTRVATMGRDGNRLAIWTIGDSNCGLYLRSDTNDWIYSMAWPEPDTLVTGSHWGHIQLWMIPNNNKLHHKVSTWSPHSTSLNIQDTPTKTKATTLRSLVVWHPPRSSGC